MILELLNLRYYVLSFKEKMEYEVAHDWDYIWKILLSFRIISVFGIIGFAKTRRQR